MIKQFIQASMLALLLSHHVHSAQDKLLDQIIVVVNDGIILQSELAHEIAQLQSQARQSGQRLPDEQVLHKRVIERLIQQKIQLQYASDINLNIDEESLNRTLSSIARNNNMDLSGFRNALKQEGITYQSFRENIRNELTIQRIRARVIDTKIIVSNREIETWITRNQASEASSSEYNLQHIVIDIPEGASALQIQSAQAKINKLQAQLNLGADFSELASNYSTGPKALDGGNIGWRKPTDLPDLFANAIIKLSANGISPILRSSNGFHLLKVLEIKKTKAASLTETLARHILLSVESQDESENKRREILGIRAKLLKGENFATVARQFSQDTRSASNGGELPWYRPGEMVPIFEETANSLNIGELSQPVLSDFGWHIIEVIERRELASNQEVLRAKATSAIKQLRSDEEYELWLRRLRAEAYIEMRDNKS